MYLAGGMYIAVVTHQIVTSEIARWGESFAGDQEGLGL